MKSFVGRASALTQRSRPARGAWVEIFLNKSIFAAIASRPARGAWVEIPPRRAYTYWLRVAPRKGRVG